MTQSLGARGEAFAVTHLEQLGYTIIDRNWHCQWGEIDIVAKNEKTLIFCEVKARKGNTTADAFVNITDRKRGKMIASAQQYVTDHALEDAIWRIDAIGIAFPRDGAPIVDYVEDALDW